MNRSQFKHIKIGTKVKIRRDLIEEQTYGSNSYVDSMINQLGKWVTVTQFDFPLEACGFYTKENNLYAFTIEMVERIQSFKYGK